MPLPKKPSGEPTQPQPSYTGTPFVRNPFNYDTEKASDDSGLACKDPSLARQEFAEESDINFIAERFGLTGELPQLLELPRSGDFAEIFDFQTALNSVIAAREQFMTLPARIRSQFNNDPQQLLQFLESTDPDDRKLAIAIGLVKDPQDAPQPAPAAAAAAPAPAPAAASTAATTPSKTP